MIVYNENRLKKTETEKEKFEGACEYEKQRNTETQEKGKYTSSPGFIYVRFGNGSGCGFGEQPGSQCTI